MASNAAGHAFRDTLLTLLPPGSEEMVRETVGGGPESRELQRTLLLASRAVEWANAALARTYDGPNQLDGFGDLHSPERANDLEARVSSERAMRAGDVRAAGLISALFELTKGVRSLDDVGSPATNASAMRAVGEAAAHVLAESSQALARGEVKADDVAVEQADRVLLDLVALGGWTTQR